MDSSLADHMKDIIGRYEDFSLSLNNFEYTAEQR